MAGAYGAAAYGTGGTAVTAGPVVIPDASRPSSTEWALTFARHPGGGLTVPLVDAGNVTCTWRLDGHAEASTSIDGRTVAAGMLGDWDTDLVVERDGRRLFRGPVIPTDSLDADGHTVTLRAFDYRWRLGRRVLAEALTFTDVEQETVGWSIIDHLQTQPDGHLGIGRAGSATGILRTRTEWKAGDVAERLLDDLGRVENGMEWEIGPDLIYRTWLQRGRPSRLVLLYGGTVDRLERTPSRYANAVVATGGEGTVPVVATQTGQDGGRWDAAVASTSTTRQATVAELAAGELADLVRGPVAWSATLSPDAGWTPERLWLGDTVRLVADSGRLTVDQTLRVHEIGVGLDVATGAETVTVTLDAPTPDFVSQWAALQGRIDELEHS